MRWTFGVEPLPQTLVAAQLLRRVTELVLALDGEERAVDQLIGDLRTAEARLSERAPSDLAPRVGDGVADPDRRVYVDHARDVGAFNPVFPEYDLSVDPIDGDRAAGTVTFPHVFEGPPGLVHGGFLAVLFDCVMQHHNCDVGVAGKTASLALRYRRPTPLGVPLRFTLERTVDAGRITSMGRLFRGPADRTFVQPKGPRFGGRTPAPQRGLEAAQHGGCASRDLSAEPLSPDDEVLCEAEMRAVVGDRSALPAVSPRRGSTRQGSPS